MIIRSKTFDGWIKANLTDYLQDISNYGCEGGFPGITYYSDTCKLFDKFQDEIFEALATDSDDFGCKGIAEFLSEGTFYNKQASDNTTHKNFLVWWYVERYAQRADDK